MNVKRLAIVLAVWVAAPAASSAADLIAFWDRPQYGANSFNGAPPDAAYFDALAGYGGTWVRLAYDKWGSGSRDFLLGSADDYQGLNRTDLAVLTATLDRAYKAGLKVVVTPLSLPGARTRQLNDDKFDDRLWSDKHYWDQAARFWGDLAARLKKHPAVAAYNVINEPAPERKGGLAENASPEAARAWYAKHKGTARDLPDFYAHVIAAIRKADPLTPVMLDAGWYGGAVGFHTWPEALDDPRLLYSFHMYEPWEATSAANLKREKPYTYPGTVPFGGKDVYWDAERVAVHLRQPVDWARARGVPLKRLVAGEFGCMRRLPWCGQYLEDVLSALDRDGLHWAFYAFREDVWEGMDYELGRDLKPGQYWAAMERGDIAELRGPNPLFEPILNRLGGRETQP